MAGAAVKDTNFNMRMNREKKAELENLYSRLGMTLPEAVNIFFEMSLLADGLPFEVRLPRSAEAGENAGLEMTDDEKIDFVAQRILREHKQAFLELAK